MLRALYPTQIRQRTRVGGADILHIHHINTGDMAAVITTRVSLVVMIAEAEVVVTTPLGVVTTDLHARVGLLERGIVGGWSSVMDSRCVLMSVSQSLIVAATSA